MLAGHDGKPDSDLPGNQNYDSAAQGKSAQLGNQPRQGTAASGDVPAILKFVSLGIDPHLVYIMHTGLLYAAAAVRLHDVDAKLATVRQFYNAGDTAMVGSVSHMRHAG